MDNVIRVKAVARHACKPVYRTQRRRPRDAVVVVGGIQAFRAGGRIPQCGVTLAGRDRRKLDRRQQRAGSTLGWHVDSRR